MSSETVYENGRLIITQTFNAPREAVFDAWIQTSKVALWWGCADATITSSDIEPKVGGNYNHNMTIKNVGDYQHHGLITEYDPPALLAYEIADAFHDKPMTVRVEFTAQGNQTHVRLTQTNLKDAYSGFVIEGWSDGFEKLNQLLTKEQNSPTQTA